MKVDQAWKEASAKLTAGGVEDALLEGELLLRQTLRMERSEFYSGLGGELTNSELTKLNGLLTQRLTHKPSAYIRHVKEFYRLEFYVDERVLIPRPETELLVEKAQEIVKQFTSKPPLLRGGGGISSFPHPNPLPQEESPDLSGSPLRGEDEGEGVPMYRNRSNREWAPISGEDAEMPLLIADIGTGCGAIAVALAVNLPQAKIYATDVSEQALKVAGINCKKHGVTDRVQLLLGDLLAPLPPIVDIIVANLPYVPDGELANLAPEVSQYEPMLALAGGADGLDYIRKLIDQVSEKLRLDGTLLLEVGVGQAEAVSEMVHQRFSEVSVACDLAGIGRVVVGRL